MVIYYCNLFQLVESFTTAIEGNIDYYKNKRQNENKNPTSHSIKNDFPKIIEVL